MTTDSYELPPMPERSGFVIDMLGADGWSVTDNADLESGRDVFTADQMREYALLAVKAERERICSAALRILNGIDADECSREDGWWETSTGAEFGAQTLESLLTAIRGA